jgi:hypothetical protein
MTQRNNQVDPATARINERLRRMGGAIDSNALSSSTVQSEEGKAIIQHMLNSVLTDEFNPAETRQMIKDRLAAAPKQ